MVSEHNEEYIYILTNLKSFKLGVTSFQICPQLLGHHWPPTPAMRTIINDDRNHLVDGTNQCGDDYDDDCDDN